VGQVIDLVVRGEGIDLIIGAAKDLQVVPDLEIRGDQSV